MTKIEAEVRAEDWENAAHAMFWEKGQQEVFTNLSVAAHREMAERIGRQKTSASVEIYRTFAIERTEDVLKVRVQADRQFCFVCRYDPHDDAPILSFHPTVEACRAEIDEIIVSTDRIDVK